MPLARTGCRSVHRRRTISHNVEAHRREIEAALQYSGGTHSFDDVVALVHEGRLQYWPAPHSVIVTEIIQYPQYRALNFFLAGGQLPELEVMEPLILDWGRQQGCKVACLTGRKGWERTFLTRQGWRPSLVVLEKQLDG
jgi:hypothetical protein